MPARRFYPVSRLAGRLRFVFTTTQGVRSLSRFSLPRFAQCPSGCDISILIATPMFGGVCHAKHFKSCLNLKDSFHDAGIPHDWLVTMNDSLITRARNTSVHGFLKTDFETLLFIDGDIEFAPEDVSKLWNLDVDVAVGAYRMKKPDAKLTVWKDGRQVDITEFHEPLSVDFAGTGFMLIQREVFNTLSRAHPEWEYEEGQDREKMVGFFQDPILDYHQSEDYFFTESVRKLGMEVICDPSIRLTHWGMAGF